MGVKQTQFHQECSLISTTEQNRLPVLLVWLLIKKCHLYISPQIIGTRDFSGGAKESSFLFDNVSTKPASYATVSFDFIYCALPQMEEKHSHQDHMLIRKVINL
jgi:hypothetical protein